MHLVFLDLEFVRYTKEYSFIVQIGAVKTDIDGNIVGTFNSFIKPNRLSKINSHFWKLTHMNKQDVLSGKSFKEVYKDFYEWLDIQNVKIIVTWGTEDFSILKNDLTKHHIEDKNILGKVCDYQNVFYIKDKKINNLKLMLQTYEVETSTGFHDALIDAESLMRLFYKIESDTVRDLLLSKHFIEYKKYIDILERQFANEQNSEIYLMILNYRNSMIDKYLQGNMPGKREWRIFKENLEIEIICYYIFLYKDYLVKKDISMLKSFRDIILKINRKFSDDFMVLLSVREKIDTLVLF